MKKPFSLLLLLLTMTIVNAQGLSFRMADATDSDNSQKNSSPEKEALNYDPKKDETENTTSGQTEKEDCCKHKRKTTTPVKTIKPKEDCGCTKLTCTQQDLTSGVCTTCAMAWKIFNCTDNSADSLYFVQLVSHFNARTNTSFASQMELAGIFKNEVHIETRMLFAGQYEIGKRNSCTKEIEFMPITGAEQCNVFIYKDSMIAVAGNGNFIRRAAVDSVNAASVVMKNSAPISSSGDFLGIPQWVLRWIFCTAAGLILILMVILIIKSARSPQVQHVYTSNPH